MSDFELLLRALVAIVVISAISAVICVAAVAGLRWLRFAGSRRPARDRSGTAFDWGLPGPESEGVFSDSLEGMFSEDRASDPIGPGFNKAGIYGFESDDDDPAH